MLDLKGEEVPLEISTVVWLKEDDANSKNIHGLL
jgi:hypothetical protein